ncbi:MAG: DNA methylase, partial [Magnetococcales bacterium]|nr:DNA methylase [Magnetococcales bacterium]
MVQSGPVECLGQVFADDHARRNHFMEILREKLKDPTFRKIEGFPIGSDDDILAMSDPPYYTACPNPFLEEFVRHYGRPYDPDQPYHRTPFAVDVSEGKTDALYKAHSYHTKVPHLAIIPSILHYTEPGDIVLDGFCGSGMTGVAAQFCGSAPDRYKQDLEAIWKKEGLGKPNWGTRRAILNDLSPAATFIAANYNLPFDVDAFAEAGRKLLDEVEWELGWMYETQHKDGRTGRIEYTVWSEVFRCPDCDGEVVFLNEALDEESKRVMGEFPCPHCGVALTKPRMERIQETRMDPVFGNPIQTPKRKPVLIQYKIGKNQYEKKPDENDLILLER